LQSGSITEKSFCKLMPLLIYADKLIFSVRILDHVVQTLTPKYLKSISFFTFSSSAVAIYSILPFTMK